MEASVATGVMGEKWRFFEEPVAGSTRSLVSATGGGDANEVVSAARNVDSDDFLTPEFTPVVSNSTGLIGIAALVASEEMPFLDGLSLLVLLTVCG